MRYLPNIISIARILLVAPTLYYLWHQLYAIALLLFVIAGVSDGVDGYLARRFHWQSRLGTYLDPIGDKLLLVGCYLVLGMLGHLPWWLVLLVIGRDIIIVIGATIYHYTVKDAAMEPLWSSKFNTVCQIILVVLLLYGLSGEHGAFLITTGWQQVMWLIVSVTTVYSGFEYIISWWHRIMQSLTHRASS